MYFHISKNNFWVNFPFNINGLLSKLDFIKIMLSETKFDIFAISESKLDASIHDNEIKIDGYDIYRLDRNRHGGGVLLCQ